MLMLFVVGGLLVRRRRLFPLLLFLDILMLILLVRAGSGMSCYFVCMLVLCVLSAALGIILLIRRARKVGRDKILSFL